MLLRELTHLDGLSGNEDKVRDYIRNIISHYTDEIKIDALGNLIAVKKGHSSRYKVMISAHMDEVGLIAAGYGDHGTIKFKTVGGIDERILPGKRVRIGDDMIDGVIGSKPIHLQTKEERNTNIKLRDMYIDIGAENREEAEKLVPLGEYIAFASEFAFLGESCVKAKALDNRVGCAILIDILKERYDFDLYGCFTVQEEIGLRGAEVATYSVNPDIALVIEGTTCSDVPGAEEYEYSTKLGNGPALTIMDRTAYMDSYLNRYIFELALKNDIRVQLKQTTTGGNDAGKIQRSRGGVKTASISIPCRYIHSPVSIMDLRDFEGCRKVLGLVLDDWSSDQTIIEKIINGGILDV